MLIRSAMSIGLHRDPEHFRLQPLEAELRRRLWWQILVQAFDSIQGPTERPISNGPEDVDAVIPNLDPTLFAEWMKFSENLDMFQFEL
jgi:hypothetical protein